VKDLCVDESFLWRLALLYVVVSAASAAAAGFLHAAGKDLGRWVAYQLQIHRLLRELYAKWPLLRFKARIEKIDPK